MEASNPNISPKPIHVGALLRALGIKQKDLAAKYKFATSEVNRVIRGSRKAKHIRQAIAMEVGMEVERLWPENR